MTEEYDTTQYIKYDIQDTISYFDHLNSLRYIRDHITVISYDFDIKHAKFGYYNMLQLKFFDFCYNSEGLYIHAILTDIQNYLLNLTFSELVELRQHNWLSDYLKFYYNYSVQNKLTNFYTRILM